MTKVIGTGIDVSHWQGDIDWHAVAGNGKTFAYMKATDGTNYVDPNLATNAKGAHDAGLDVGFYHFARFTDETEAVAEAKHYVATVGSLGATKAHVLDLEVDDAHLSRSALAAAARTWLDYVAQAIGEPVMLYTYVNFANTQLDDSLAQYPLWIAHYDVDQPDVPAPWHDYAVWQYTSHGSVEGIAGNVDLDTEGAAEVATPAPAPTKAPAPRKAEQGIYVVQSGDTLSEIAHDFKTTVDELVRLNHIADPDVINVGERLKLPEHSELHAAKTTYTIQSGDTFWGIEAAHGWAHGTLKRLNPHVDPRSLRVGQSITVPFNRGHKQSAPHYKPYKIEHGDTLGGIASRFGVSVARLAALNNIDDPNRIFAGQTIKVPR